MATYVPNATQATEPVASQTVFSAAEEFRTLKASVNAMRQWLGTSATAPATDTLGNALTAGDFYYNTTSYRMFVHNGSAFIPVDSSATVTTLSTSGTVGLGLSSQITVITPTGNITLTASSMLTGQSVLVLVTNPGTFTATWPSGIKWLNGVTPTLLATGTTFVEILKVGSDVYGVALGGAV
jgi:hypothetical protein